MGSMAQQQLGQRPRVQSPVVNGDGTVTFNFYDPSAQAVSVNGDFEEIRNQRLDMSKQENGVWTVTTKAPLAPELYSYSLNVDGQRFVDPANSYVNRDISTLSNIFIVTKEKGDKGSLYSVNNVPHGTLSRVWYDSSTLGQQRRMTIYLPPQYDGKKQFPVMYLLHGHGGDETAWGDLGRTSQIMDNLIAEGKIEPFLVVTTYGMINDVPMGHMTDYTAEDFETVLCDELVPYIESHYKARTDKFGRAMAGLSMGGYETTIITLRRPEMFGYYGLLSGGSYSPKDIKDPGQVKGIFIGCGSKENADAVTKSAADLREAGINARSYVSEGTAHEFLTWRRILREMAPFLFK